MLVSHQFPAKNQTFIHVVHVQTTRKGCRSPFIGTWIRPVGETELNFASRDNRQQDSSYFKDGCRPLFNMKGERFLLQWQILMVCYELSWDATG